MGVLYPDTNMFFIRMFSVSEKFQSMLRYRRHFWVQVLHATHGHLLVHERWLNPSLRHLCWNFLTPPSMRSNGKKTDSIFSGGIPGP